MIIKIFNRQKNIIVNSFLILVLTVFCSIDSFARTFEELSKAVAALPETTKQEKIKKALNPDNKAGRIVLLDTKTAEAKETVKIQYPHGFEFQEGNRQFRIIFNPTNASLE